MDKPGNFGRRYVTHGVLPLTVAAISWGFSYFIRKYISHDVGVFAIVFMYSVAAVAFLYAMGPSRYRGLTKRFMENWRLLVPMSVLSVTLGGALMNMGLKHIDLGIASLLDRLQVVFTIIIAAIFLGERLTRLSLVLGTVGVVSGVFLLPVEFGAAGIDRETAFGAICVVAAAFIWAISSVLGGKLAKSMAPFDMVMIRAVIGVITSLPFVLILEPASLNVLVTWKIFMLAGLGGIFASALGYGAYYYGLKTLPVSVAVMMESFTPLTCVLLGISFLGEHMTRTQQIAAAVLLASLTALIWVESRQPQPEIVELHD